MFKLGSGQLGGRLSVVEHPIDPGVLVPPHIHSLEDQISLVVAGSVDMLVGEQTFHCEIGAYVFKPRGIPHTFWNAGSAPARIAEISVPGGAEVYMEELFEYLAAAGGAADSGQISGIASRYGITLLPALAQRLCDEHGLRLMGRSGPEGTAEH